MQFYYGILILNCNQDDTESLGRSLWSPNQWQVYCHQASGFNVILIAKRNYYLLAPQHFTGTAL